MTMMIIYSVFLNYSDNRVEEQQESVGISIISLLIINDFMICWVDFMVSREQIQMLIFNLYKINYHRSTSLITGGLFRYTGATTPSPRIKDSILQLMKSIAFLDSSTASLIKISGTFRGWLSSPLKGILECSLKYRESYPQGKTNLNAYVFFSLHAWVDGICTKF